MQVSLQKQIKRTEGIASLEKIFVQVKNIFVFILVILRIFKLFLNLWFALLFLVDDPDIFIFSSIHHEMSILNYITLINFCLDFSSKQFNK